MAARKKSLARDLLEKVGLVFASFFAVLLVAEFVVRISSEEIDTFTFKNFALSKLSLLQSTYPASYHERLGWIPTPGFKSKRNVWNTRVTIDDRGVRRNGTGAPPPGPPVLAIGDSFTFGDEVNDDESLPAMLEKRLGRRVVNGAVFGYGMDQMMIRTEMLAKDEAPTDAFMMIVPEDIWRTMLFMRSGIQKPYFDLVDNKLQLKNVPVPPERPKISDVGLGRKFFGYSYLVDWTYRRLNRAKEWYIGDFPEIYVHDDRNKAQLVSCAIVDRFAAYLRAKNIRGIFIATYSQPATRMPTTHEYLKPTRRVLGCAKDAGLIVIDTHEMFHRIARRSRKQSNELYVKAHLSKKGNDMIAARIEQIITSTTASR